jgi:hypothetical protein
LRTPSASTWALPKIFTSDWPNTMQAKLRTRRSSNRGLSRPQLLFVIATAPLNSSDILNRVQAEHSHETTFEHQYFPATQEQEGCRIKTQLRRQASPSRVLAMAGRPFSRHEVRGVEMPPCRGGESGDRSRHARHLNAERKVASVSRSALRVPRWFCSVSSRAEQPADNRQTLARYQHGVPV